MLKNNIRRIVSMAGCIKNPPFFKYRLYHYLKRYVPVEEAKKIANRNLKSYQNNQINEVVFETYDGSCQAVHPDITFADPFYWIAVTPYPYGMEEYENPCVYKKNSVEGKIEFHSNPIAMPREHDYGVHLSDPCIFYDGTDINCVYRDTWKSGNSITNALRVSTYHNQKKWSEPWLLIQSEDDPLLSPALLVDGKQNYHVYTAVNKNVMVHRVFDADRNLLSVERISCIGLPDDYMVWHMSIVFSNDLDKKWSGTNNLKGIFLLRNCKDASFRLHFASSKGYNDPWLIEGEIALPQFIFDNAKVVYKSCFIPNSEKILIGFRDKKDRYRLCVV